MDVKGSEKFSTITNPGTGGLHTIIDAQDIDDTEMADCRNVLFSGGFVIPRQGFQQLFAKPSGETAAPNTLSSGKDSDSNEYIVPIYGTNFYLWDPANSQTVLLNTGSGTSISTIPPFWSYAIWNAGTGSDVMYFVNGSDTTVKWHMALTTTATNLTGTATSVTVVAGDNFPTSGTLIVQAPGGSPFAKAWTSKTGVNQLNFASGFGQTVASGATATIALSQVGAVPTSSIVITFQRRLFAIGGENTENLINYSVVNTPEDFTSTSGANGSGAETLADGNGPITFAVESGGYVFIGKQNSWSQFQFIYSSDVTTTKLIALNEVVTGHSVGPVNFKAGYKAYNNIDFVTVTEGIFQLDNNSGYSSAATSSANISENISINLLSKKINNRLMVGSDKIYYFDNSIARYWDNKGFFAVATAANTANSLLLMYDYLYQYWTVFDGWNVTDMTTYNNSMYFLSNTDGSVNQAFMGYQDGSVAFTSYYLTKRYDFGDPALPKTMDKVFLQGLISNGTTMTINAYMNEVGSLASQVYTLKGNNTTFVNQVAVGALGQYALGTAPLGWITNPPTSNFGYYRCYLDISNAYGFYNFQLKFSSTAIGAAWAVDKIGMNPTIENTYPTGLVLGPG